MIWSASFAFSLFFYDLFLFGIMLDKWVADSSSRSWTEDPCSATTMHKIAWLTCHRRWMLQSCPPTTSKMKVCIVVTFASIQIQKDAKEKEWDYKSPRPDVDDGHSLLLSTKTKKEGILLGGLSCQTRKGFLRLTLHAFSYKILSDHFGLLTIRWSTWKTCHTGYIS